MVTVPKYERTQAIKPASPLFQSGRGAEDPRAFGLVQDDRGAGLAQLGNAAFEVHQQIQARNDATAGARALTEGRPKMTEIFTAEQTAGSDFSKPQNVQQFEQNLRKTADEIVEGYEGSEKGRARLSVVIEREVSRLMDMGAARGLAANKAKVESAVGQDIDNYAQAAVADTSSLTTQLQGLRDHLTEFYGAALDPKELDAQIKAGQGQVVTEAIGAILAKDNGIEEAAKLLQDPEAIRALTSKQRTTLRTRILEADSDRRKARAEGSLIREKIGAALGVAPADVPDTMVLQAMGVTDKNVQTKEISDITSPTGIRIVAEADAIGKPGVAKRPLVQVGGEQEGSFQKEMGKLEAGRVSTLRTVSDQAYKDLNEITRMRVAMDTDGFKTGAFGHQRQFLSRVGEFFGVPPESEFFTLLGHATTSDTIDAAANALGVNAAANMSRVTNMSLQFVKDSLPSLTRTPDGNRVLISVMERVSNRQIQLSTVADEYARAFNTLNPTPEQWQKVMGEVPYQSFAMAQAKLEVDDPIISDEIKKQINDFAKRAPKTIQEQIDAELPAGLPSGSVRSGQVVKGTGEEVWIAPNGAKYKVPAR